MGEIQYSQMTQGCTLCLVMTKPPMRKTPSISISPVALATYEGKHPSFCSFF